MDLKLLAEPFDSKDVEFRAGATTQDKTKALALAYITSRAVMDRLDQAVGPENWRDEYTAGPDGGVLCGISIRIDDEWITKFDGAANTNYEAVKGGLSDAFKRAAVKWAIGRYLYALPSPWVACEVRGKTVKIDEGEARRKTFGQPQNGRPKRANWNLDKVQFFTKSRQDFSLTNEQVADVLKAAGFTNGYDKSKARQMYEAVKLAVDS